MPDKKLTVDEFALKIKAKYPQYKDMDNYELTNKIVEKYPDYSNSVDLKKKAVSQPISVASPTGGYGSQFGSQTFQPTNTYVPAPLIGKGAEEYKKNNTFQNIQKIGEANKAQPKPKDLGVLDTISEYLYLPSIGQNFSDVVVKPMAGATDFLDRTIDKAYTTITGEKTPDWLRKGGGFDAGVKFYEDQYKNRIKPTNLVSEVAEGTLGTLPLIAALATGEGEVNALSKAPELVSNLTKYFTVKGALNSYKDATDEKLGYIESLNKASKGGLQGFEEGLTLDATMLVGGALGKGVAQQLLDKGLLAGGKSTEAVLHALAVGTTFAGTSAGDDLLNGRDINTREALKQFGTGLAFELIPTAQKINEDLKDKKDANDISESAVKSAAIAKSASNLNSESAVRTLLNFTPEQIKSVNDNIKQSKDDLYAASIESGAKAYEENDPAKKKDLYINQLGLKSQGDIKLVSEKLGENYNEVKSSIENSIELTPEEKVDLTTKIDLLAPKQIKENAIQKPSTSSQVPPVIEGGQNLQENGTRVGQGEQGTQAPQEVIPETPKAISPEEALRDVESTAAFIADNNLSESINSRNKQLNFVPEGKTLEQVLAEKYHKAKADGSNPEFVKAVEDVVAENTQAPQEFISEKVSRLREQEQAEYAAMKNPNDAVKRAEIYNRYDKPITEAIREAKQQGVKTVKLEVNKDLANNGIGLRAVEMPDGKFGIFKEVDGKVTGKSLGRSFETIEELQSAYDGGIKDALTADAIKQAEQGAPQAKIISPENSSNYANLTEDDKGNFVFYHFSNQKLNDINPSKYGSNPERVTSPEEATAMGRVGGMSNFYPNLNFRERQVSGKYGYEVKIPKEKVYDFNTDVNNYIKEAKARFEKENPGAAFTPNDQLAYITKIAEENGYDMVVAEWADGRTRANSTKVLKVSDFSESDGNKIKKDFKNKYQSNIDKGFETVRPESKDKILQSVYNDINKERNSQERYDDLYRLYSESNKYTQDEITKLINESDISNELKAKYNEAVNYKEQPGSSKLKVKEVIQPNSAEQARLHNEENGSTFTVDGVNRNGTKAASVSIFPERTKIVEGELTKEDIDGYVKENSDIYAGNGDVLAVGTWRNNKTNKNYLDVSAVLPKKEATRLGKDYNQISVWDLEKGREIPTGGTGEAIEGLKPEIDRVSDIRKILGQEKGLKQAELKTSEKPINDSLQKAKDKLAAAKAKLDASKKNMGVAQDPKQRAKDLFEYHSSLVDVAKEYIKYGVNNIKDFAKELGEGVSDSIKAAWDEANGLSKKKMKDFIDATEAELIGITKKDIENLRENMGEDQFEYETQTREKLVERAAKKIEEGTNVPDLIEKINNGTKKTVEDIDVELIRQYYASLTAAINEAPTPELLAQRKALLDALDKAKVSAGRAVQAFDGLIAVEDNLSKFLADESKYADLTPEEITNLTKQYERIQEVHKELEDRYAKLEAEAAEKAAKDRIAAVRASERKAKAAVTKMNFKDERKVYVDEFRKRLKEIRSGAQGTIFPYQRELVELAPFVAKMVKSYVSEGIFDLKTIVEGIHEQFKDDIEGLSPEDIRDIIAGKYVDTKQTKDAKLAQIRDLKSQARIEGEIENLKNGIEKETKPVEKRKKSDKLVELEKELKEIKRRTREENAPSPLDKKKTYYQNKIDKLKSELASGDFAEVKEPVKVVLDSEGLKLQDEYNKLVNETRERRDAKEREAMSKVDKALEKIEQVTGLKRLVQTALDLSIPLRQGVAVMLNPRTAKIGAEAYVKMIKSVFNIDGKGLAKFKFDDKFYNRMMSEIERSPNYLESKADGIVYTELGSKIGEKRDESHPSESFVYNIPYLSAPFRASERAAAGWTNAARFELYNRGVKQLLAEGKTRENSPQAYEDMAARVMVDTGRGKIPGISDKATDATGKKIKWALSKTMYGARLFSSSIRKLNPLYYLNPKVDKTVRVEAFKDMIGYTTSQILLHVAIASAIGATVSLDPDDSDFLKLRLGKKIIDLTAGQSAYIRTFLRLVKAAYLQSDPEISKEDANKYSKFATSSVGTFFRNKLAPNTSYAVNAFMGTNSIGEKFDPYEIIKLYPMYTEDLLTAFENGSMLDAAVILPISISGLGYQEYSKNIRQAKLSNYLDTKDSDLKSFLNKNKLTVSSDINQEIYNPSNGNLEAMDKAQSDKFESAWAKYVMQEIKDSIPAIEAMKADIFSKNPSSVTKLKLQEFSRKSENKDLTDAEVKDKFYQAELNKKISTIKTDGNDYAKEVVIGFPKDLLKVEVNINGKNVPHSLTKQEVDKRVIAYKKYIKENQDIYTLSYNDYIANGETPANAKKLATRDLKMDAISSSGDEILDKYYDESTGEFKF
jgi:hypothetical protein